MGGAVFGKVSSLPTTLTKLGLVRCSIGDQGARALLDWVKYANGMPMICVEDNTVSVQMRKQSNSLRGMSVFI